MDGFALVNLVNGSATETDKEGLLILTMIDSYTEVKQNGTVCADNFDGLSAHMICRSIGYVFADWGSDPTKYANE